MLEWNTGKGLSSPSGGRFVRGARERAGPQAVLGVVLISIPGVCVPVFSFTSLTWHQDGMQFGSKAERASDVVVC
jgi:hypothetical protein